jgi:hypothetical protein
MGLLDIFKQKPRLRAKDFASRYGLRYIRSDNPVIAGSIAPHWWIGEVKGVQITMRDVGVLEVVVGEMLAGVDYILTRVDAQHPLPPPGSDQRLDARVRIQHPELTRWYFSIVPHGRAELEVLEVPEVLDALGALSGNVNEIAIYRWGVEFRYPVRAEEAALHRDIENARSIRIPMEKYRQDYLNNKEAGLWA